MFAERWRNSTEGFPSLDETCRLTSRIFPRSFGETCPELDCFPRPTVATKLGRITRSGESLRSGVCDTRRRRKTDPAGAFSTCTNAGRFAGATFLPATMSGLSRVRACLGKTPEAEIGAREPARVKPRVPASTPRPHLATYCPAWGVCEACEGRPAF